MKLVIEDIVKSFGDNEVLKGIDFQFEQGSIYALLGRNGSGKTTLFSIIAQEIDANSGKIYLVENETKRPLEADDFYFMVANPTLPNFLTGYEFIKFFYDVNKPRIKDNRSIEEYLDWIGLTQQERHRLIQGYSLGMKNKLQMLMFVMLAPPIILMDEPLTSLDVLMQHQIKQLIKEMRHRHIILFSTHILQLATDICDEIVILNHGHLTQLDHEKLNEAEFEESIIEALSENDNHV